MSSDMKAKTGLTWSRRFEGETLPPSSRRDVRLTTPSGEVVFEQADVEAPAAWSDRAVLIAAQKYFVRTEKVRENSVYAMVTKVAQTIATQGMNQGYFATHRDAHNFQEDLIFLLINQYGAFNSPVWFNVRRWHSYEVPGGPGNWAWDVESQQAKQIDNAYARPQCAACFIHTIEDSLVEPRGIADFIKAEMRLFKFGSGSGANFSKLREKGARLTPGGVSSGLMSFLPVMDRAAGSVASGGTSRRAAKMVCVDADHPEILDFIRWKAKEERKAQDLIAAGWSNGMEGEAYTTVGGQNANNSVRVTDEFMNKVVNGETFELTSRVDGRCVQKIPAKDLWLEIAKAAWECADPGLQFHTTINAWHTTPKAGEIRASNPCSEFMTQDDSACNLASLNLRKFLKNGLSGQEFHLSAFLAACETFILAMDILVDYGSYPTREIAEGAHNYRQLGLGYANLGAYLAEWGIAYDSLEGRNEAAKITHHMTLAAYHMSAKIASVRGSFEGYHQNSEDMLRVLKKHRDSARALLGTTYGGEWENLIQRAKMYGMRNAQVTLLAPTGTIALLMDCDTTGIEPLFSHVQTKDLAGGGTMKIVSPLARTALTARGYEGDALEKICAHITETGSPEGAPGLHPEHLSIFDTAIPTGPSRRCISPEGHLKMMASVQPFLTGAISKTCNLPSDTTVEQIAHYHMLAWQWGLKSVALYRDGCKGSQPLTAKKTERAVAPVAPVVGKNSRGQHKLPSERRGTTWALKLDGHKIYIRSGEYEDGSVGELFVDLSREGSTLRGFVGMWAKAVSLGLQYGVPLSDFVDAFVFTRFEPFGRVEGHSTLRLGTSIVDVVMRSLAIKYLKRTDLQHVQDALQEAQEVPKVLNTPPPAPVTQDGPPCPTCGTLTVRTGNCHGCPACGASMGCS